MTDGVIITDERIGHIESRHKGDYEQYNSYIPYIISDPDYIIRDDRPFTAILLKGFIDTCSSKYFRLALRLHTSGDEENFYNSIITFMKIREKEYRRLVKNKIVLYKKE